MRLNTPLAKTVSTALGSWVLTLIIHSDALDAGLFTVGTSAWFIFGLAFTQLVEFWYHRVPMHRGFLFFRRIKKNHLKHHRLFRNKNFRVRNPKNLDHIAGQWYLFPAIYFLLYAVLRFLIPPQALIAFLAGTVVHYAFFEMTHWFTHIEDNVFDRWIFRIPLLNRLREYQILHHRLHHERPNIAFNFNPPYLGDVLLGLMPKPLESPDPRPVLLPVDNPATEPLPINGALNAHPSRPGLWSQPAFKYGSAISLGFIVIGAALIAYGNYPRTKVDVAQGAS